MRGVEGFRARQAHAAHAGFLHFIQHPGVVGKRPFPRGHSLEQNGEAALALHVQQRLVPRLPVERRERLALKRQTEWQALDDALARPELRPKQQVVHEAEKLKVGAVPDYGAERFPHKRGLDTCPAVLGVLLAGILVVHLQERSLAPASRRTAHRLCDVPVLLSADATNIVQSNMGFRHVVPPVQVWP